MLHGLTSQKSHIWLNENLKFQRWDILIREPQRKLLLGSPRRKKETINLDIQGYDVRI